VIFNYGERTGKVGAQTADRSKDMVHDNYTVGLSYIYMHVIQRLSRYLGIALKLGERERYDRYSGFI